MTKKMSVPTWLDELLPEWRTPALLRVNSDKSALELKLPDGVLIPIGFDELHKVNAAAGEHDIDISSEVYEHCNQNPRLKWLSYPDENSNFLVLIFSTTDKRRYKWLASSYHDFLGFAEAFEKEPNFHNAYHFLDTHPAFWTCQDITVNPWVWDTYGHCSRIEHNVFIEDGKTMVMMETGEHVASPDVFSPPYKQHYHDPDLDTIAESFEEAFIELATLVARNFNNDGSKKTS